MRLAFNRREKGLAGLCLIAIAFFVGRMIYQRLASLPLSVLENEIEQIRQQLRDGDTEIARSKKLKVKTAFWLRRFFDERPFGEIEAEIIERITLAAASHDLKIVALSPADPLRCEWGEEVVVSLSLAGRTDQFASFFADLRVKLNNVRIQELKMRPIAAQGDRQISTELVLRVLILQGEHLAPLLDNAPVEEVMPQEAVGIVAHEKMTEYDQGIFAGKEIFTFGDQRAEEERQVITGSRKSGFRTRFQLIGCVVDRASVALFEDNVDQQTVFVSIGEMIDGLTITAIDEDGVILRDGNSFNEMIQIAPEARGGDNR